jgi:threonine/homoserine/homoserine lactone efflux protein
MFEDSPGLFLLSVAFISLSGVLMPGPVFAATVAQGYKDRNAGLSITLGHALVELPLIILIFLGFDFLFKDDALFALVAGVGGAILIWMGLGMVRAREIMICEGKGPTRSAFLDGVITTITNPYWLMWWATVGAALVATAVTFGTIMLPVFAAVHLGCDVSWEYLISNTVYRTKGLWNIKWHHLLILASGILMLLFGVYFLTSSISSFF